MKKIYRIKKEKEFKVIIQKKKSFANRNFVIYISDKVDQPHFRVGLSVGKRVGNAVMRNKVKRLMRESLRALEKDIPSNYNLILIARPNVVNLSLPEVKQNIYHVLKLANLIEVREVFTSEK